MLKFAFSQITTEPEPEPVFLNTDLLGKLTFNNTLNDTSLEKIFSNPIQANNTAGAPYIIGNPVNFNTTDQLYGSGCLSLLNNTDPNTPTTWVQYNLDGTKLGNQFTMSFSFNPSNTQNLQQNDQFVFNLADQNNANVFTISTSANGSMYINSKYNTKNRINDILIKKKLLLIEFNELKKN